MHIEKKHAEFLAKSHARRNGQIRLPGCPVFTKFGLDGTLRIAYKIIGADRADWQFASFPNQPA